MERDYQSKAGKSNIVRVMPLTLVSTDATFPKQVQKFKSDYAEFRKEFECIKEEVRDTVFPPFYFLTVSMPVPAHCRATHQALLYEHWHAPNAWRWKTALCRSNNTRHSTREPLQC